ncbi:hypothetical protein QCE63_29500 [Caballeronia sp. LZ065]|uniref:hypothetical protein n=1 Tax=Caballeronia sp. LZ065 TaxID=3038571 RepID=UPI002857DB51|nr:hypothetical protein [Caballeronia sp. LZ065]MDR5783553.1 hypothetical protein [Caballeronia sp. LZ065]
MRRKSSGFAVAAVLIGVAVAAVVYIASIGHSRTAEAPVPTATSLAAQDGAASGPVFGSAPAEAATATSEQAAAR